LIIDYVAIHPKFRDYPLCENTRHIAPTESDKDLLRIRNSWHKYWGAFLPRSGYGCD